MEADSECLKAKTCSIGGRGTLALLINQSMLFRLKSSNVLLDMWDALYSPPTAQIGWLSPKVSSSLIRRSLRKVPYSNK